MQEEWTLFTPELAEFTRMAESITYRFDESRDTTCESESYVFVAQRRDGPAHEPFQGCPIRCLHLVSRAVLHSGKEYRAVKA